MYKGRAYRILGGSILELFKSYSLELKLILVFTERHFTETRDRGERSEAIGSDRNFLGTL